MSDLWRDPNCPNRNELVLSDLCATRCYWAIIQTSWFAIILVVHIAALFDDCWVVAKHGVMCALIFGSDRLNFICFVSISVWHYIKCVWICFSIEKVASTKLGVFITIASFGAVCIVGAISVILAEPITSSHSDQTIFCFVWILPCSTFTRISSFLYESAMRFPLAIGEYVYSIVT